MTSIPSFKSDKRVAFLQVSGTADESISTFAPGTRYPISNQRNRC
jgi:hypothetical protein